MIFVKKSEDELKIVKILADHNHVCGNISDCNKFFSKILFTFIVTIIISDLVMQNQIFFETINLATRLVYLFIYLGCTFYLGFVLLICAYSSKGYKKAYKMLINLVWKSDGMSMAFRIKVINLL
jgi:hypothetical protein